MSFQGRMEDSPQFRGEELNLSKIYQFRESHYSGFSFPSSVRHHHIKKEEPPGSQETKTPTPNLTHISGTPNEASYEIEKLISQRIKLFEDPKRCETNIRVVGNDSPRKISILRSSPTKGNDELQRVNQQIID